MTTAKKRTLDELADEALEILAKANSPLRCGYIGDCLFARPGVRLRGSAPFARVAGRVMRRLKQQGRAFWGANETGIRRTAMTTKRNGQPCFTTSERCDDKPRRAGQHGPIRPSESQLKLAAAISLLLECGCQQAAWEALGATGEPWTAEDAGIAASCALMRLVTSGADAARAGLLMTIERRRIEPDDAPAQDVIDQVNATRWAALMEFDGRFPGVIQRGVK